MALIKCKECTKEISDKAEICPHCGIKIEHTDWARVIIWGLVFSFVAYSCSNHETMIQKAKDKAAKAAPADKYTQARGACILEIKKSALDPSSVVFAPANYVHVSEYKDNLFKVQQPVRMRNEYNALKLTVIECNLIYNQQQETWLTATIKDLHIQQPF